MSQTQLITLRVDGMSCGGCGSKVRESILAVPGVKDATVNLATHTAVVTAGTEASPEGITTRLKACGYDATHVQGHRGATAEQRDYRRQLLEGRQAAVQAVFMWALPVLALDLLGPVLGSIDAAGQVWWRALQAVLCGMALHSPAGAGILYGGLRALVSRAPNIDLLLSVGLVAAYLSSVAAIFLPSAHHYHFQAVVLILAFVNLGRLMELRARGRVVDVAAHIARRLPHHARRIVSAGAVEVPVQTLQCDDVLRVSADHVIPVDGQVLCGGGAVDESVLTGDAQPVSKGEGDIVSGGTVLVSGSLMFRVTGLASDSAIGRIQEAVRQAQCGSTRAQQIADRDCR